eukprot:119236_1
MSQDPKEEKQEESLSARVEETLNNINQMENNLQSLINMNKVNTLQLMSKLKSLEDTTAAEAIPAIVQSALDDASHMMKSKTIEVWTPPNSKQCAMAATNPIPYTKNQLSVPSKTSLIGIITNSKEWDKFFTPKIAPKSGDWLAEQVRDRKGQTFLEFYNRKPRYPSSKLNTIGLIAIGNFNINLNIIDEQEVKTADDEHGNPNNLLNMLSSIVEAYYGMKIKLMGNISSDNITSRHNDSSGTMQLLTTDIHDMLFTLKEQHDDLFCLMGVSIIDLYPRESWNFVFGQARIKAGTGVFSFARYMPHFSEIRMLQYECGYGLQSVDAEQIKLLKALLDGKNTSDDILKTLKFDKKTQILFFRRCVKVLVHEIGHLFGIKHCVFMECIMNGSNHGQESDMKPVHLCPVCLHKLYLSRLKKSKKNKPDYQPLDILERYRKLAVLCETYGLVEDAKWYQHRVQYLVQRMEQL